MRMVRAEYRVLFTGFEAGVGFFYMGKIIQIIMVMANYISKQ